jgi:anti-sigma B factor antagonist
MNVSFDAQHATLWVTGRVDASNASELDQALRALEAEVDGAITVDLADATYISSSGLRYLLLSHRRQLSKEGAGPGPVLHLCHVPPRILRVLQIAGLDHILSVIPAACEE